MAEVTGGELLTLWKVGRVAQITAREQDIVAALEHNHQTLAAVRQRSAETGTPAQPTIINAEPGQISTHLHPK